ncbi:MAG: SUMF1/EgtB/PvdO family nonheme iron enzyme [Treponema sp.]|nr:SUMF1/EgtB/PvdO family nonheme iron enzyme [Treponema sp.]
MKKTLIALLSIFISIAALTAQEETEDRLGKLYSIMDEENFVLLVHSRSGFAISKTEVTQELYELITGKNPSNFQGEKFPVDSVSYYDAIVFCNLLSMEMDVEPVYSVDGITDPALWTSLESGEWYGLKMSPVATGYRLPTKEEWLFAARGGSEKTSNKYVGGDDVEELAWYNVNSDRTTHDVGQKSPNEIDVYDMNGNVWEWCWDGASQLRPNKFIVGGGYDTSKNGTTIANCVSEQIPTTKNPNTGFRIVRGMNDDEIKAEQKKAEREASAKSVPPLFKAGRSQYPISQWLWYYVMKDNPLLFADDYAPVYNISYYQAIVFCNRLSKICGRTPVYELNKSNNPNDWGTIPTSPDKKWDKISMNKKANGYVLEVTKSKDFDGTSVKGFYIRVAN